MRSVIRTNDAQGLAVLYFISSSSIPRPKLPSTTQLFDEGKRLTQHAHEEAAGSAPELTLDTGTTPKASPNLASETADGPRMNATFVTLARNSDVWEIAASIRHVEDRFNRRYNYDWVFLNDKPFDAQFKRITTALVSGKTKYGVIPKEHWSFPEFIDQERAKKVREEMAEKKVIYGDSISYRHMCRFESGFFFRQPPMLDYELYWRVEPGIKLFCDLDYDPFKYMVDNGKKYSFVISLYEYIETIPTLWDSVKKFMKAHPEHVAPDNSMGFLSDDGGDNYNKCHFVGSGVLTHFWELPLTAVLSLVVKL